MSEDKNPMQRRHHRLQRRSQHRPAAAGADRAAAVPGRDRRDHRRGLRLHRPHRGDRPGICGLRPSHPAHRPGASARARPRPSTSSWPTPRSRSASWRAATRCPTRTAIENLVRMFRDPAVGMTGAQKVAVNTPDHVVGLPVPPAAEDGAPALPGDPAPGRADRLPQGVRPPPAGRGHGRGVRRGACPSSAGCRCATRRTPWSTTWGRETVGDFVRQRRRNYAGHLYLDDKYGYRVSSLENRRVVRIALEEVWGALRLLWTLCLPGRIGVLLADAGRLRLSDQEEEARGVGHGLDDQGPGTGDPKSADPPLDRAARLQRPCCGEGGGTIKNPRSTLLNLLKVAISLGLIAYIATRPTILHADWGYMLANLRPVAVAAGVGHLLSRHRLERLQVAIPAQHPGRARVLRRPLPAQPGGSLFCQPAEHDRRRRGPGLGPGAGHGRRARRHRARGGVGAGRPAGGPGRLPGCGGGRAGLRRSWPGPRRHELAADDR